MNSEKYDFSVGNSHLTGILEKPASVNSVAIILHPHPLYGGDMSNPVVTSLSETLLDCGLATFRFDFRGADSRSEYAGIPGAVDDTISASALLESQGFTIAGIAGYSFGGSTALRFSSIVDVDFVISVSSSLDLFREGGYPVTELSKIKCPVLLLHGTSDLTVPYENMIKLSAYIRGEITSIPIEHEGHFYHQSLNMLREEVKSFMNKSGFSSQTQG